MRILACGGRDFSDIWQVREVFAEYAGKHELCHGGARGADALAGRVGDEYGWPVIVFPADWRKYGKAAGPIRNRQMLVEFKPDLVIAFPGGRGTADMIAQAKRAGVAVREVSPTTQNGGAR